MRIDPERDTQELFTSCEEPMVASIPYLFSAVFAVSLPILLWTWKTGRAVFILYFVYFLHLLGCNRNGPINTFTRKHGRWKSRLFYPVCFGMLSSVSVQSQYVVSALNIKSGRARRITPSGRARQMIPSGRARTSPQDHDAKTPVNIFTAALEFRSDDPDSFFCPEFFNLLPFEESDPHDVISPALLHLTGYGSDFAMMHTTLDPFPDMDSEDYDTSYSVDDASEGDLTFKGQPFEIPDDCWSAFEHLQPQLSQGRNNCIVPSYQASTNLDHLMDSKLYLRRANVKAHIANNQNPRLFPVLVDTGCSVATSGFIEDFGPRLIPGDFGSIKTANGEAAIKGFGMVKWRTVTEAGALVDVEVPCYYAPDIQLRLFSPQDYARYHKQSSASATMLGSHSWFGFTHVTSSQDKPAIVVSGVEMSSRLFFFYAQVPEQEKNQAQTATVSKPGSAVECHVSQNVHDVRNVNLSPAQKALLLDHQRLGHFRFPLIQALYQEYEDTTPAFLEPQTPCTQHLIPRTLSQLTCDVPICATCQVAKARRRTTHSKRSKPNPEKTNLLRAEDVNPGDCVSMDQYESSVRGRLPHTRGRERSHNRYRGGTLFFDHASTKIFVRHQVDLGAYSTVDSKHSVERESLLSGVTIKRYHTDNGIFTANEFERALCEDFQGIRFSGVGAHHQNGVAERAIGTAQNMARAMLLHL